MSTMNQRAFALWLACAAALPLPAAAQASQKA